jgi:hypothetical protein
MAGVATCAGTYPWIRTTDLPCHRWPPETWQCGSVNEGDTIKLGTKASSLVAVAMFALAAGGIAAAVLVPSDFDVHGNTITAGHLQVHINQPDGTALSLDNMEPGEHRIAYQLITGDMSGVATAELGMTLFSADAGLPVADPGRLFAENASLSVSVSAPEPESAIGWSGGTCTPSAGFPAAPTVVFRHISDMAADETGAFLIDLGEFTGDTISGGTAIHGNDAVCVRFDVGLDAAAGNEVQDTSGTFAMSYSLTQTEAAGS